MKTQSKALLAVGLVISVSAGCNQGTLTPNGTAAIVGSVVSTGGAGKVATSAQLGCPDFVISLNGSPTSVTVQDDCSFLVDGIAPAASYVLSVELVDLGVTGTVELTNVLDAEIIEILVQADDESLSISIVRRSTPDPIDDLPDVIDDNNVEIFLPAGTYDTNLTVDGNNFTLVGEAGEDCDDEGWTVITGDVLILKNNATFRNVRFEGLVEVEGNNADFINVCFGEQLIIFGNNTDIDDSGDDDDDDDGDEDDDDGDGDDDDAGDSDD